jgi:hypothetical protein
VDATVRTLQRSGLVEGKAVALANDVADELGLMGERIAHNDGAKFYDLRSEQDFKYPGRKRKVRIRDGVPVRRRPERVTGIVVHQTAVVYGVGPALLKAAGGDADVALAMRGLETACHAIAFRRGIFVATHDLDVHVNQANGFNATTLGLEVEGRYPGLVDDPSTTAREDLKTTWGGKPTPLDESTVSTARTALKWLVDEGRSLGMPIRFIYAHRQASPTRRSCPGEGLWRALVPWAEEHLGLESRPRLVLRRPSGPGRPIPKAWDANGFGRY